MEDSFSFFNYMRLDPLIFDEILNKLELVLESERATTTLGENMNQT